MRHTALAVQVPTTATVPVRHFALVRMAATVLAPLLLLVVALPTSTSTSTSTSTTGSTTIQCDIGWAHQIQDIPQDWMDDGYCDCPLDGADEPNTDACSGSQAWPGILPAIEKEEEAASSSLTFQCPQQPSLKLPLSRLSDGICDCCDGADEAETVCPDNCADILRAEREERARKEKAFAVGHNKRKHELFAFKQLREYKLKEIESLVQEKDGLDVDAVAAKIEKLQLAYLDQRMLITESLAISFSKVLAGVTATELRTIIVLACQVAGEMAADDDTNTCAALRLAGLEMGMTWPEDNYNDAEALKTKVLEESSSLDLAIRLFSNVANQERNWNIGENVGGSQKKRRRLDETFSHDDDYVHNDDEFHIHHHEDEDDHDDSNNAEDTQQDQATGSLGSLSGLEKELVESVQSLPFSATRTIFLTRSKELIADINRALLTAKPEETKNSDSVSSEEESNEATTTPTMDRVAYNMLRNSLRRKEASIVKGFKWGASSQLFFSANSDLSEKQLQHLAAFTIFHGNLSALHVWQILQVAVDDFFVPSDYSIEDETCASPWASSCPPKKIRRGAFTVPDKGLVEAAEVFCSGLTETAMEACSAAEMDANGIPSAIPDGYYGYVAPVPRDEKDYVSQVFSPLTALPVYKEGLENFEKEKSRLEQEKKDIEKKIADTWDEIGGENGDKMGPNGELASIANKCFDVLSGKYTYEVCLFGEAKQKEGTGNGGTGLGRYTRMKYDEETGERILYWENGARCWNGPSRSATVYLTCGPENKVLSADEPDTCRYVLQMESFIACDEKYKNRIGL